MQGGQTRHARGETGEGEETCEMRKRKEEVGERETNDHYRTPESFTTFCNILSFTAANTSRILPVSVAYVKLHVQDTRQ